MILTSTYEMYKAFLDGIKKSHQGTVNPAMFNRIINDWGQDEFMSRYADELEVTQKEIDKISILRVITDGIFSYSEKIDGSSQYVLVPIPVSTTISNYFEFPFDGNKTINNVVYPAYRRLASVQFQLQYSNDVCNRTGLSEYKQAKILRSDQRTMIYSSSFRKPSADKLYYLFMGKHIVLDCGQSLGVKSVGKKMILEYYRYPRKIFYNTNAGTTDQVGTAVYDYSGTTAGSVPCEFAGYVRKEIVDIAVRLFLERVKDPRYQSFLNELKNKI